MGWSSSHPLDEYEHYLYQKRAEEHFTEMPFM
jgi:hypothetical protein